MNSLMDKIQIKFQELNQQEKILAIILLSILTGVFLFVCGITIGKAIGRLFG